MGDLARSRTVWTPRGACRRPHGVRRFGIFVGVAFACSTPSASITITTGGETDTLTRNPAVTSILVEAVDRSGNRTTLQQTALTRQATIDLGDVSQTTTASVQLTGSANGTPVVFGAMPYAELGVFGGLTADLFVQRKGELARMPGPLADGRAAPFLAASGRAIYAVGGTLSGAQTPPLVAYDLVSLAELAGSLPTPHPQAPLKSFALIQRTQEDANGDLAECLFVDANGATVVGLASQSIDCSDDPALSPTLCTCQTGPSTPCKAGTLSWSDVAGGATVIGDDGTAYIVGPSRSDALSNVIVALPLTGSGVSGSISTRQGAAVAWVPNKGVFVYGGSSDPKYTGAELVSSTLSKTWTAYPPDSNTGLSAIVFDANTMLVAGGGERGAPRRGARPQLIDLTCTNECVPQGWGVALPTALVTSALFSSGTSVTPVFIIVGDDVSGATHVYRLDATTTTEIPLKIPRQGARAVQIQTGAIVIVGGGSGTLESYVP